MNSTANTAVAAESSRSTHALSQFLTFILAGEEYGVQILRVQEIKGWNKATKIPNVPSYILGVINLRGEIVPIMDMRKRFHLEECNYGPTAVIIVVKIVASDKEKTVGLVVDAVSEVYKVEESNIQSAPDFFGAISNEFVAGLATVDDKMIILLEVDNLVNSEIMAVASE